MSLPPAASTASAPSTQVGSANIARLAWVDRIKAIALIWIFINHLTEQLFGSPYFGNPSGNWPPLAERISQLRPFDGYGVLDIPLNILRYIGWSGDEGVQLFLLISGFGLTWGLLARQGRSPLALGRFYLRRIERIYPLWWGAHLLFVATFFLIGWGIAPYHYRFFLSMIGFRITEGTLYFFVGAWWFFGLLIQLYAIYPILWAGLVRFGPLRLLIAACGLAFVARALGFLTLGSYIDAWNRGAWFITQLPSFVLGMSLAAWLQDQPEAVERRLRTPALAALGLGAYILGAVLSLTLLGMAVVPFLQGLGLLLVLYYFLGGSSQPAPVRPGPMTWIGQHSLALFLIHHPAITLLVPDRITPDNLGLVCFGTLVAALVTAAGAIFLERAVKGSQALLGRWYRQYRLTGVILRLATIGLAVVGLLLGAELIVRQLAPQEVFGWGERPSLEPHDVFGWRLKPSSQTRLRWLSYDYVVTANTLGFPGPEYPPGKTDRTLRIMTTGDAFTSAEGVDTAQAWPRLLEAELAKRLPDRQVEVMNFGITGYGPNQYKAVIETFAPTYQPDLIIIGFFVNDYEDVLVTDEEFRSSIGFANRPQDSLDALIRLEHWMSFVGQVVRNRLMEFMKGEPDPNGYFLGNFAALERDRPDFDEGREAVALRLRQIKAVADATGARVIIAMIPASVQICGPDQLAYYPRFVDLGDTDKFDSERPQRTTEALASALGLAYYDLRPVLQAVKTGCPYQPYNMHWLPSGHQEVATYLADVVSTGNDVHHAE